MMEVQRELAIQVGPTQPTFGDTLQKIVWKKFYEARSQGLLEIKVWFLTVSIEKPVRKLVEKWFGIDPYAQGAPPA